MNTIKISSIASAILLTGIFAAGLTHAQSSENRVLRIHNRSGEVVRYMYVSNVGTDRWGPDQLGQDVLDQNTYVDWNIDDHSGYCRFDFKFVLADGTVETKYRYNVCAESDLYVVSPGD
jgi:hypothetical protein